MRGRIEIFNCGKSGGEVERGPTLRERAEMINRRRYEIVWIIATADYDRKKIILTKEKPACHFAPSPSVLCALNN